MSAPRALSSECIHASTVAIGGRAVLISGPSGSGKSDLALRLLDRGFTLVSDDQTLLRRDDDRIVASAPPQIAGKLEVRGVGIVELQAVSDVPVALVVELTSDIDRLPDEANARRLVGVSVPTVSIDALTPSAAAKVVMALDHLGLEK